MNPGEVVTVTVTVLVFLGGIVAVWVKLNNQIAVLEDRSQRDTETSEHGSDLINELRRQIAAQQDEIEQLRAEVREERAARERQEMRHNRELSELNDQLSSVSARLAVARQRLTGLDGQN